MSQEFVIEAFPRDDQGRGASRRLRRDERKIPAIIYGGKKKAIPVAIWHNELLKAVESESIFSQVLTIELNGKKESVILKDLQRHPYKLLLSHADFQRVDQKQELFVHVPIHLVNDTTAPAVKNFGGIAFRLMTEVEVACLPKDLPQFIELDMTDVEMDQVVHMSELKLPKGVRIPALALGAEHDQPVASIQQPRVSQADEAEDAEDAESASDDKDSKEGDAE